MHGLDEMRALIPINLDQHVTKTAVSFVYAESLFYSLPKSLSEEGDLEGIDFMNSRSPYGLLWTVARQLR